MFNHIVYIYKVARSARRIAYIYSSKDLIDFTDLPKKIFTLSEKYELSIHKIKSDAYSSDSLVKKDQFFEGIEFFRDIDEFEERLYDLTEGQVSPLEFSQILLSRYRLDKLQVQKALYLIYEQGLKEGIKIFNSSPVAYKYGPVFEDVYQQYKDEPAKEAIEVDMSIGDLLSLPKSSYRTDVRRITEEVMDNIIDKSGSELIDLCHDPDGPWAKVYEPGKNNVITDEIILASTSTIRATSND